MSIKPLKILTLASLAALVSVGSPGAYAIGFGDMMNPSRWFGGGNRDRYNDDYYYDDYGPGPWGGPYGGPYGAPYGAPGYAPYGGVPGYGAPAYGVAPVTPVAPAAPGAQAAPSNQGEIDALKRRIEELEASQRPPQTQPAPSADWPSAPAFRPMNQY